VPTTTGASRRVAGSGFVLAVLLVGWSVLEGIGAALIMPAIVALVAGNFPPERRSAAYGMSPPSSSPGPSPGLGPASSCGSGCSR
jgi:MFS family permease